MREGDDLFFAPGVRFSDVDLGGIRLPEQYRARIEGFYLRPAGLCTEAGHAFAAGLLIVSTIDFMAGFHHSAEDLPGRAVGADFREFARRELRSFGSGNLAQRLFDDFRNGLSHEARIKCAGEFSFDRPYTVRVVSGRLCINPAHLLREVEEALERQMAQLAENAVKRMDAAERLRSLFSREFGILERARNIG
jgi:hypothetical protein